MVTRVGVLLDEAPSFMSQQEQIDFILECLGEADISTHLVVSSRAMSTIANKDIDLLIVDYGGISAVGGMDQAIWQLNVVRQYAEDHPSVLVVVWTDHTTRYYKEVTKTMPELPNVLLRYEDNWYGEIVYKLKRWFEGK